MSHLDRTRELPYCAGCGHPHVLRALDEALDGIDVPPERLVLVTDIGCVGLADPFFPGLHTVHALHGRAVAVAAGLLLGARSSDRLKAIVLVGDGGAAMGLLHLVHASQIDVDLTVVVHNNLVYGMTGGQHSALTPPDMPTTTTAHGSGVPPLDLAGVLAGASCGFYARTRAPGEDLVRLLGRALRRPGFAVVEALELCPTFAARQGGMTGKRLDALPGELGLATGLLYERAPRTPPPELAEEVEDVLGPALVPDPAKARLARPVSWLALGRAGERVQSAARLLASAAVAAGLHATVSTDNPVTQGRGWSLAEVRLSPTPIRAVAGTTPDVALVTAEEGRAELARRHGERGGAWPARIVADVSLEGVEGAPWERRDLRRRHGAKQATLGALMELSLEEDLFAPEAWEAAAATLEGQSAVETRDLLAKVLATRGESAA